MEDEQLESAGRTSDLRGLDRLRYVILQEPLTKLFLYAILNGLNFAVAVEHWGWKGVVGTFIAVFGTWKAFMSDSGQGKKTT